MGNFAGTSQYALVASSSNLSAAFRVDGFDRIGVVAPVIASCQAILEVSAVASPGASDWTRVAPYVPGSIVAWAVGAGSTAAVFDAVAPFPWARITLTVSQTNAATLTIIGRRSGPYG